MSQETETAHTLLYPRGHVGVMEDDFYEISRRDFRSFVVKKLPGSAAAVSLVKRIEFILIDWKGCK